MRHVFRRYPVWISFMALNNHCMVHDSPSAHWRSPTPTQSSLQHAVILWPPFNSNNLGSWEVLLSNLRTAQMLMKQRYSLHTTVYRLQPFISLWTRRPSRNINKHFCFIFSKYKVKITAQKPANLTKVGGGFPQSLQANVNGAAGLRRSQIPVLRVYDLSWQSTLIPLFWPHMTHSNKLGQDNTASQSAPPTPLLLQRPPSAQICTVFTKCCSSYSWMRPSFNQLSRPILHFHKLSVFY
jgi:hypothetical protein